MRELITRGYAAADATAVAELFNALARDAGGPEWAAPAAVQSYVDIYLSDPGRDSRLVLAPDRTLVGVAMVTAPPAGGSHVNLAGGVHPAWRGRGVGRRLLGWQLDRSRQIHEAQAPGTGWDVHADADLGAGDGDAAAVRLFWRFGLAPVRYWFSMAAPTAVPPAAAVPDGLRLERYSPGQELALHAAHMEAFADHWGFQLRPLAQWTPTTVGSDRFIPELSLLAFDRDELAGYLLSYQDVEPDRIYIGQVGSGHRGGGGDWPARCWSRCCPPPGRPAGRQPGCGWTPTAPPVRSGSTSGPGSRSSRGR